jgi:ectoine hydroxylase-related dioxygenase (phytanoyl-CoA dioxygenase family)
VLSTDEVAALAQALMESPLTRTRAGARHLMQVPAVARLANHPRLLAIAGEWLDGAAVPFKATLFDKSADANWLVAWHQDTALPLMARGDLAEWGPWSEKAGIVYAHAPARALQRVVALRMHLDDSNPDNGPLRVLPGTHELGLLSDEQAHDCARALPAEVCCVAAGGIVVMRPLLVHASSKAGSDAPRRVIHIEYADSLQIDTGLQLRIA